MPNDNKKLPAPLPSKKIPSRDENYSEYQRSPVNTPIEKRSKIMPVQELPPTPPKPKR